jgi:hypothetical protein
MQRMSRSLAAALFFALLGPPVAPLALAQSDRPGAELPYAPEQPTVLSVLARAKDLAESGGKEAIRLPLRYRVALAMRKTGLEPAFDDYVATSLGAWETWDPRRNLAVRAWLRQYQQGEADAKRAFLAGDPDGAGRLLRGRPCLSGLCFTPSADVLFL